MSNPLDYTIGWICAMHTEYVAALAFLDEKYEGPEYVSTNDNNDYTLAVLLNGEYGLLSAASVARDMLYSFPNYDICLGDVVVGVPINGKGGPLMLLWTAVGGLMARYEFDGNYIKEAVNNTDCVAICGYDPLNLIERFGREEEGDDDPAIHYGLIASANTLMRDASVRDKMAKEGVLCFETEAAGLMNHFPCLVICGICDYADSHINKTWQGYAAMAAAAYTKDLLDRITLNKVKAEIKFGSILSVEERLFYEEGDSLINSTYSLWKILRQAIEDPESGSIVIVLDALDECAESEFTDLMHKVKDQFDRASSGSNHIINTFDDLDLEDETDFKLQLRSLCGLFISVYYGKVYFHQTACEFLLADLASPTAITSGMYWHYSITTRQAYNILAELCVLYLNLFNSGNKSTRVYCSAGNQCTHFHKARTTDSNAFLDYSAKNWGTHFREAHIIPATMRINDTSLESYWKWFAIYQRSTYRCPTGNATGLIIASYHGHRANIKARDNKGWTPLSRAAEGGHEAIVKLLVDKGGGKRPQPGGLSPGGKLE
ncbi:nucleoside phosphorylase domain-containing protein [Trichoderma compactum]